MFVIMLLMVECPKCGKGLIKKPNQCDWVCPECGSRCGGVMNHKGEHQCPIHYKVKVK